MQSILQALNNPMIQNMKGIAQMIKGNPQAMMNHMMRNNPNMQRAIQLIQQNGGDAQKAFYSLANQMGVDPNDILSLFK